MSKDLVPLEDKCGVEVAVEAEIVDDDDISDLAHLRIALAARRVLSMQKGQINNGNLYAGSPLHYYCKFCGVKTDTKSEGWFLYPPEDKCPECKVLIELGWHDGQTPTFPFRE